MDMRNHVAALRQKRGFSVASLAAQVGVKRQTIYAVEAGSYIPNTKIALKLAQALDATVEELFAIESTPLSPSRQHPVQLLKSNEKDKLQPLQPLRLCRVDQRLIAIHASPMSGGLPDADALLVDTTASQRAKAQPLSSEKDYGKRLLVAGCDPGMAVLARQLNRYDDIQLILAGCSSLQALHWLKEKTIHIAGTHLRDMSTGESNLRAVKEFFPRGGYRLVSFAGWEEGLVLTRGNPKRIRSVEDLLKPGLRFVNREPGAGSRFLLDSLLRERNIDSTDVHGYERIAYGHMPAAWLVQSGEADCCIANRAAAQVFGLHFIPLISERFDLVIPQKYFDLQPVQIMLDAMNRLALKRELKALGGYDTRETGSVLAQESP